MYPINKFKFDDCTGKISCLWHKVFEKGTPWESACIKHKLHYWLGGSSLDRHAADMILYSSIFKTGHPLIAISILVAIRIGGHPSLPFAWHWGFGHDDMKFHRRYYDRHHDTYAILARECKKLNIKDAFGGKI